MELAQRKFLRQVASYADAMNVGSYPRLLMIDLFTEEERYILQEKQWEKERKAMEEKLNAEKDKPTSRPGSSSSPRASSRVSALPSLRPKSGRSRQGLLGKKSSSMQASLMLADAVKEVAEDNDGAINSEYCMRVLCEHDGVRYKII